jgi:hypothetical protein
VDGFGMTGAIAGTAIGMAMIVGGLREFRRRDIVS